MMRQKTRYLIGTEDKKGNLFIVTDMTGNILDSLIPVKSDESVFIPNAYLFPYHTFPRESRLNSTKNMTWTVIKAQIIMAYDETETDDDNTLKDVTIQNPENINHPLGIGKAVFITLMGKGGHSIEQALDIRDRLLREQAIRMNNCGDATNFYDLLHYNHEDENINKSISRNYRFPLSLLNLDYYAAILNKGIPVSYSLITGPKPYGVGDDYLCPHDIEKLSLKAKVILYNNCPQLYVKHSQFIHDPNFVVEAINQGATELISLIFRESTCNLVELKNRFDAEDLVKTMGCYLPFFHKDYAHLAAYDLKDIRRQAEIFNLLLSIGNARAGALFIDTYDMEKVRRLILFNVDGFMDSLQTVFPDKFLDEKYFSSKKGSGKLLVRNRRIFLCKGSILRKMTVEEKPNLSYTDKRNNGIIDGYLEDGIAEMVDGKIVLMRDVEFAKPSMPATLIYPQWSNGWTLFPGLEDTGLKEPRKPRTSKKNTADN